MDLQLHFSQEQQTVILDKYEECKKEVKTKENCILYEKRRYDDATATTFTAALDYFYTVG